jgi:integrase
MRAYLLANGSEHPQRDATFVALLAYAGLRPGEALALRWGDIRERTLLVQRAEPVKSFETLGRRI